MKVNEVVEITKGKLLTSPTITELSGFISCVDRITKGDVFIAQDPLEIPKAIESGAYGIIVQGDVQSSDEEVAWIEVEDMTECLIRLIRYKLLAQSVSLLALSPIQEAIAKEIITDSRVAFCDGGLGEFLEILNDKSVSFVVAHNDEILNLSFEVTHPHKPKDKPFILLSHTLFDMSIFYSSAHYRLNLPKIFSSDLGAVLNLCTNKSIEISLDKFTHIPYFKPNFLNSAGKIIEYGQASKVAIAEEDIEQFKKYMAYIANNATWGKILFLVPLVYLDLFSQIAQTFAYKSEDELCEYLQKESFNFALILGVNDKTLVHSLTSGYKPSVQPDLFAGLLE